MLDNLTAILYDTARHPGCPPQAHEPLIAAAASITAAEMQAGVAGGAHNQPGPDPAAPAGAEAAAWHAATAAQALYREPPRAALPAAAEALRTLARCLDSITVTLPARPWRGPTWTKPQETCAPHAT